MRKTFLLTLLLTLWGTAVSWAQFSPEAGKMYALKESTSGLYLDIQTLGINEPNANSTTNNISLNEKPCIIYFEAGTTDNTKWTLKNVNGTYVAQASGRDWNAVISNSAYEWTIAEPETNLFTIARSDGGFISMDSPTSGSPLYCDKGTGLKFKLIPYSDLDRGSYTIKSPNNSVNLGAIQSSAALNAITTSTKIVIKNISSTNSKYYAGDSNVENIEDAILVWEPVTEGTPGKYYLRTTDATNGYVQKTTGADGKIALGAKTGAQVFYTTAPTTSGSDSENLATGTTFIDGADSGNLVRFVQEGGSTWLNVQGTNGKDYPILGHTGKGNWTVHNVYLLMDATYLSLTQVGDTKASFQTTPTNFYVTPSAGTWFIESKDNAGTYVGSTHAWNTTTDFSLWTILAPDEDGYAKIARAADNTQHIGSDQNTNVGTGIFTNVGSGCNGWLFDGTSTCTTTGTNNNGKYHFTSESIWYPGACNTIRFTLTESGAFYQNDTKRLSFDSFILYDANGKEVELKESYFSGNNSKSYAAMLDGANGTYTAGEWSASGATDDYFEIALPNDIDLGGAFSFSFVTENTTMNAKAFRIDTRYEKRENIKYTFAIDVPEGHEPAITYDGETVAVGTEFEKDFDADLFAADEIEGYTWSIAVDNDNATITLVYTEAPIVENPQAVVDLANRIGGTGTAEKFKFVQDPSINSKQEVFVIGNEDNKILIKGTTISAITTGLGWYLNHHAKINIAWNSLNEKTAEGGAYADLSNLPVPTAEETHTSDAKYRYYLNTCTFGYSMTSWTWKRWQQEIDWMALHGINMPLQLVGMEEVWRKFLTMEEGGKRKYGYTDAEAKAFVAGPAFIAWWAMNNLEGWGGTAPGTKSRGTWEGAGGVQDDAWYVRQKALANSIVTRQRELGMQPVLPGWSGMVPTNFASKSGYATRGNGGNWAGDFVRPLLLSVSNANYAEIAADYYTCLKEVMGESQYYSMDPFHEGGGAGTMEDYEALYAAMETAKPGSQWVIQQWQWSSTQKYSLTAVPAGRLVVLDLFSDGSPAFDSYNGYAPQEAVFCAIPNFGGRSGLMGRLNNLTENYFTYKSKYASIKGIGAAPEAIEQTPVTYDLIFQLPWMNGVKPDVAEWVKDYATARYGVNNAVTQEAWELLRQGPLNYGADGIQGPVEDVWAARPNLTANKASSWGVTLANAGSTYTKARRQMLIDAVYKLLSQEDMIGTNDVFQSNFNYDLVEFGGAVMADYAYDLLLGVGAAKTAAGANYATDATYIARRDAFLALIEDVDAFKGTNLNFRLGKWTQEARDAAGEVTGATTATPDWYEYNNARTIVSTWSSPNTNLNDYSYRSWQGLMKDLYLPRWKHYFDNNCTTTQYGYFEWNWAHGKEHYVGQTAVSNVALTEGQAGHTSKYTREPEGNTVTEAWSLLNKYIVPIKATNGTTKYAYRHLGLDHNDYSSSITIEVPTGNVDLTPYVGNLTNVTLTSDAVTGNATDVSAVTITGSVGSSYATTLTFDDKTVIKFTLKVSSSEVGSLSKVTDLSEISNTRVYSISTDRGPIAYVSNHSETELSTPKKGSNTDIDANATENANEQFAILRTENTEEGKYYLYNLSKKAFINIDGSRAVFSATPVAVTSFTATNNADYPWFVYLGGEHRMNINAGDGLVMRTDIYASPDEGNRFYLEPIADDSEATAVALQAVIAQEFLNATPTTVGYPKEERRNDFQTAIDAHESVEALTTAKNTFISTADIVMPENGKAYKISAWWRERQIPMTFVEEGSNLVFNGSKNAYAPVEGAESSDFVCRLIDTDQQTYAFVSNNGYYLGWQADGKDNTTSATYTDGNSIKVAKAITHNKGAGPKLTDAELLGKVNIYGRYNNAWWDFMYSYSSKNFHDAGSGTSSNTKHYGDDAHTVYYTLEEVETYTLNRPTHTSIIKNENPLLNGLEDNQTISTFSAPYATVMPEGVTAYYAKQEYDGNMLYLTAMEEGQALPAGQGVILIGSSVDAAAIVPATTELLADITEENNFFKSSATGDVKMGSNDYILAKGNDGIGIYHAIENTILKAGKAYLHFENATQASSFVLNFGIEPTSIDTTITEADQKIIYDLSGRRVNEVRKGGIYIVNGKKVFIK